MHTLRLISWVALNRVSYPGVGQCTLLVLSLNNELSCNDHGNPAIRQARKCLFVMCLARHFGISIGEVTHPSVT